MGGGAVSEAKFTPGPWVVSENKHPPVSGYIFHSVFASTGETICEDLPNEEGKADAHLIAAAPDLYTVLNQIATDIEAQGVLIEWHQAILDVLAEARGDQ
jgi:hypothetical protein